ncbi:MAG: hypothetical protein R2715_20580 [Ilumatobacteraceae bacterium]
MVTISGYLLIGAVATVVTLVTTPFVAALARHRGWVVEPDERRVHDRPTPDVGGIAMFAGFLVAFGVAATMDRFADLFRNNSEPIGVVLACSLVFLVGLVDDIVEPRRSPR